MSNLPLSQDIADALGRFFHGGSGPSHTKLTGIFTNAGLNDVARDPGPSAKDRPNKECRVRRTVEAAQRRPARARQLVEGLLSALRVHGVFDSQSDKYDVENVRTLRRALEGQGWDLSEDGNLSPKDAIDLETGGRTALDDQIYRLRQNSDDPALLIGTAKELLESVAKFVLQELQVDTPSKNPDFGELWYFTRDRLGILPERVAGEGEGSKAIKAILSSAWKIVEQVNVLRNLQGTGHGRTLPSGVSAEQALLVVREACSVAEFTLATLDRQRG